ncbi:hypothetical protein AB0A76_21180 [Streptomyces exfoliatus]|uniref:Uncharacterized protein n=1 Tax=Streptomyces exfoliatus TaxID=1905 RepID=A0ABV3D196_STREX
MDSEPVRREVASQEERGKIGLVAGNINGVAAADDKATVTGPVAQAARFATVTRNTGATARRWMQGR